MEQWRCYTGRTRRCARAVDVVELNEVIWFAAYGRVIFYWVLAGPVLAQAGTTTGYLEISK